MAYQAITSDVLVEHRGDDDRLEYPPQSIVGWVEVWAHPRKATLKHDETILGVTAGLVGLRILREHPPRGVRQPIERAVQFEYRRIVLAIFRMPATNRSQSPGEGFPSPRGTAAENRGAPNRPALESRQPDAGVVSTIPEPNDFASNQEDKGVDPVSDVDPICVISSLSLSGQAISTVALRLYES